MREEECEGSQENVCESVKVQATQKGRPDTERQSE